MFGRLVNVFWSIGAISFVVVAAATSTDNDESSVFSFERISNEVKKNKNRRWTSTPASVFRRFEGMKISDISSLYMGIPNEFPTLSSSLLSISNVRPSVAFDEDPSFDWRNGSLANCVGAVVDQERCGSCWAVSAVESFADRLCIFEARNNDSASTRVALSALDLIACDKLCEGFGTKCCRGCSGGYPKLAFEYIQKAGIVSKACMPYNLTRSLLCPVPKCKKPLDDRVYMGKDSRHVVGGAPAMQREIKSNGPISATFTVYEDFLTYSNGVYEYSGVGRRVGLHAVKVVGWGTTDDGTILYWKCQNSWGTQWGMDGTFNIAFGQCGFELNAYTATPCLDNDILCHSPPKNNLKF